MQRVVADQLDYPVGREPLDRVHASARHSPLIDQTPARSNRW